MTDVEEAFLQPPRLARAFLVFALPSDPIRDAILGDLHEEFLDDASTRGVQSARVRYARRTVSILVRAVCDAVICREWVSTGPAAAPQLVTETSRGGPQPRARAASGFAGFVVVALIVLVLGVVVNTILFSATAARHTHASSAASIGGVAVLVASVIVGAVVMCAGPRWRKRVEGSG